MLGIGRRHKPWYWGAFGKHPAARDFFKIGDRGASFDAFATWIENGYGAIAVSGKGDSTIFSWRFWSKGIKNNDLVIGIVKDSSDSIGRPYPLLLIGHGSLAGWEEKWEYLLFFLEKLWERLEYVSSKRLKAVDDFEKEFRTFKCPADDWERICRCEQTTFSASRKAIDEIMLKRQAELLATEMMTVIPIDEKRPDRYLDHAVNCSSILKTYGVKTPNAIFIGGAGEKHYLALVNRPLNAVVFKSLWSVSSR